MANRRAIGVLAAGVVGACAYQPGTFRQPMLGDMHGERATAGCLDVAVAAQVRPSIEGTEGQVVEVSFANRCNRAVVVDFPALRATGRDRSGAERALSIYDPNGALRPLTLEARRGGREVIELVTATPLDGSVTGACLDIASLARAPETQWVCVAGQGPAASVAAVQP